ncbi:nickel/cobalt efflux transporter [Bordetella petrii]|uniref:nickel/cobalt efflux transporter n=1 Tax=Bordetella petrii TaxID=94624 RepID=UPI001A977DB5|nr:nickel/cobalt efflux transporter RcnA [Bordetella petrii]
MLSFTELMQQGAAHAWLFIPSAIVLGALHGLEPGHSKTMMAAFIVAIRGTMGQAILLGLTATISHTLVVWGIALGGMYLWRGIDAENMEPYFQLASAAAIIAIAIWMFLRTLKEERLRQAAGHGHHGHDHGHAEGSAHHHHHGQHHGHGEPRGPALPDEGYQDAHELAHAHDIQRRFAHRNVTHWQIALFGLTGGLIPCPAAITVLLLCLQLKQVSLGAVLVLCFSVGLALTLVTVGMAAAWSVRHVNKRYSGLSAIARRAPYLSSLLIIAVGLYVGIHGWLGIAARG